MQPAPQPEASWLNEPQRRHLGVTLGQIQQLLHEIGTLLDAPSPRDQLVTEAADLPAEFIRRAPALLAEVNRRITALAERFDLPRRERSRYRWVRAVLGSAVDNLEDTRPGKLHPYGAVHPALDSALDPPLRDLQEMLRHLLSELESGPPDDLVRDAGEPVGRNQPVPGDCLPALLGGAGGGDGDGEAVPVTG